MASNFADLRDRTLSAVVMVAVGIGAVWAGGVVFLALVATLTGAMVWELARMHDPAAPFGRAEAAGFSAAVALAVFFTQLSGAWLLGALALAVALLAWRMPVPVRAVHAAYLALILLAGAALLLMRGGFGWEWVLWLVLVVIASDVGGYFAGRLIGGPKLWPRVSPKKTWSGTVAGWVLALVVGWAMMGVLGAGTGLLLASVLTSMAGQAGDIAESALKRRAGIKDSSNLIPGHGGVLDRFDAMIAAAAMFLILNETGVIGGLLVD